MVDSRDKGARAETVIRDVLRDLTGLKWERVPGSGALDPKHGLKGDLYVPGKNCLYCVECKHYAEDQLSTKLLTSKSPILLDWWDQTLRQARQINKKPLLIFKHDRSKLFCAFEDFPYGDYMHLYVHYLESHPFYIALLEDYIKEDKPRFVDE